jgi:3-phosphoshikimate 1-carboxyvinyltransferase
MSAPRAIEPLQRPPDATVVVPGSKSITNRAVVAAMLASGTSRLRGALFADDTEAMLDSAARLRAGVVADADAATVEVTGFGGHLPEGPIELDARLSGTTARFVLPILGLGAGPYHLDGGDPLRRRPMGDGIDALRSLGVEIVDEGQPGHLPVTVGGGFVGGDVPAVSVPGATSSQFLSGLLLVGPCLDGGLTIEVTDVLVSEPYVAMTVEVMQAFGAQVDASVGSRFVVMPGGYTSVDYAVEPDASAASYFFAAAAICGGRVTIEGLSRSSLQGDLAFVEVLERMGASVDWATDSVTVRGTGRLRGVDADLGAFSDMAQTLAVTAVFADSSTTIDGIGFIRRKETDRIAAMVTELRRCGITVDELDDGLRIEPGAPRPAVIETYDDHRMAMSFSLLGLRVPGIAIADPACVAKTFPGFFGVLDSLRRQ